MVSTPRSLGGLAHLAASFAASCLPATELPAPPVPPGSSVLVVALSRGDRVTIAAEPDAAGALAVTPLTLADDTELYAFVYGCSLASLGLEAGRQLDTREPPPPGEALYELPARARGRGWAPRASRPASLARSDSSCSVLTKEDFAIPGTKVGPEPRFAIALDAEHVLVGAILYAPYAPAGGRQNVFWIVGTEGPPEIIPVELRGTTLGPPAIAGFTASDGRVFLLLTDGRVAEGDLTRGFTVTSTLSRRPIREDGSTFMFAGSLGGNLDAGPLDLYASTRWGTVERLEGSTWRLLDEAPPCTGDACDLGAVLWLAPEDVLVVRPGVQDIITRVLHGEVRPVAYNDPGTHPTATTLGRSTGFGVIVGTTLGALFRTADLRIWETLRRTTFDPVVSIAPLDDGLVVNTFGTFTEYSKRSGACLDQSLGLGTHLGPVVPLGRGYFTFSWEGGNDWAFHRITAKRPVLDACHPPP